MVVVCGGGVDWGRFGVFWVSGAVQRVAAVLVLVFVRAERAVFRAGAVTRDNVRVAGPRCDCCWRAALTPSRGLARQRGAGGVVCGCGY